MHSGHQIEYRALGRTGLRSDRSRETALCAENGPDSAMSRGQSDQTSQLLSLAHRLEAEGSPRTFRNGIPKRRKQCDPERRPWVAYAAPPRGSVLTAGKRVVVKAVRRFLELLHPARHLGDA